MLFFPNNATGEQLVSYLPQVIRTYDRGVGIPRKRPPRSKKLSTYLEIFDFEEEEEEEDEEEVDDLERFSQALADEEKEIREKEKLVQTKKPPMSTSNSLTASTATYSRGRIGGRGRGRAASSSLRQTPEAPSTTPSPTVRGARSRGRPPRGNKISPRTPRAANDNNEANKGASSDDDYLAYEDDANDDDYKPVPRGRGRGRGRSRGRR